MPITMFSVALRSGASKAPTSLLGLFWLVTKPCRPVMVAVLLAES